MRKLMSIFLCFVLLISLAACAGGEEGASSAADTTRTDTTTVTTTTTTESTESTAPTTGESTQNTSSSATSTKPSTTTKGTTTTVTSATTTTTKPTTTVSPYMKSDEDVLKTYFTGSSITKTHFMAAAGYMVDGVVKDTMFESFAFTPTPAQIYPSEGFVTAKSQWQSMIDELFLSGKNMDALEAAVGDIKSQLKLSDNYKVKVYLPLLCAVKKDTEFGEVKGKMLNFSSDTDRLEAVKWLAQEQLRIFKSKNYKNIKVEGFFWFKEEVEPVTETDHVKQVCQYIHSLKYDIIWSPYFQAKGYSNWKEYGFDRTSMQANYYPGVAVQNAPNGGPVERLSTITASMKNRQIGIEMELGSLSKNSITGFKQYMQVGVEKGYMNTYHAWYLVNGPTVAYNLYHSRDAYINSAYNEMYKFIKGTLKLSEMTIEPIV